KMLATLLSIVRSQAFLLSVYASLGTLVGGLFITLFFSNRNSQTVMGQLQAFSSGVMLFITCFHLITESIEIIGSTETFLWMFFGVVLFAILETIVIPEETEKDKQLTRSSVITFIAMALHNLPEGLGVYLSSLSNPKMGLQLAVAIMLHNIPEGMAVAIPIYASTKSVWQVLWLTFLNGLAEPIGVLLGGGLLGPYLTPEILNRCLALVGGIMLCISIHELMPMAIEYSGRNNTSIFFFLGMFICWGALEIVESYLGGHSHDHSHHSHSHSHSHDHSHHEL
ncbi:ZIP zinc transporter-domain-containing protein, partial [Gorgonomyces haynaldii]